MSIETDSLIVGAGPVGLFQVFELGLLGIQADVVDALPGIGGQCRELYPDKPIYDIPAIPKCTAMELVNRLMDQIQPFNARFHFDQQVSSIAALDDLRFRVVTTKGTEFLSKSIVIAGGVGSFEPMLLRIERADPFVDKQIFYRVKDPELFADKDIVILGGGDSAFDWTNELIDGVRSLTLVHRSENFRAVDASVKTMRENVAAGKMQFMVGNATDLSIEQNQVKAVHITLPNREVQEIALDYLLVFFGLSPRLGPIAEWGLELSRNQIQTDTEKFESNIPGIYAIGDIATYPGKKKLILSGFHEATLAAFAIKERLNPNEKVHLQYTTTSPLLKQRLGVEE